MIEDMHRVPRQIHQIASEHKIGTIKELNPQALAYPVFFLKPLILGNAGEKGFFILHCTDFSTRIQGQIERTQPDSRHDGFNEIASFDFRAMPELERLPTSLCDFKASGGVCLQFLQERDELIDISKTQKLPLRREKNI